MASSASEHIDEGRLDLVPMIDCILLLLIFLMLTIRLGTDEQVINALLPEQGSSATPHRIDEPRRIGIAAWPDGLHPDMQPAEYGRAVAPLLVDGPPQRMRVRVAGRDPILVDLAAVQRSEPGATAELHAQVRSALMSCEEATENRHDQLPVEIHCFSGMDWNAALQLIDAVRAYELALVPAREGRPEVTEMRQINLAPPRMRGMKRPQDEIGEEIWEILHVR